MKVGIIGCGAISRKHLSHIRAIPEVEIVGVSDTDEESGRNIARRFGIPHVYQKASEMLEVRRPDVVHILTPPQSHKELSIQAMQAGCHVLVEKPMALSVADADEMIAASRHHLVKLAPCHNFLFDPAVMKAKRLVASGTVGQVVSVEVFWRIYRAGGDRDRYRTTRWVYELPGGIFHEPAPHAVYLLMEFLRAVRVGSAVSKRIGSDLPAPSDELRVLFEGESGLGAMSVSVTTNPYQVFLNIYGTEMTLHVDLLTNTLVKLRRSGMGGILQTVLVNSDQGLRLLSESVTSSAQTPQDQQILGHGMFIRKFYESVREGTDPPVTAEAGRAVVEVLSQVWAKLGWER